MRHNEKSGIFIIAPITGPVGDRIAALQGEHDPRILKLGPPHVTVAGSSGVGPIRPSTPVPLLREKLEPIASTTAPFEIRFQAPMRFMQTKIVSLPLDPHGLIRRLHERIATSGIEFPPARFAFTPHCTLNFYRTLTPDTQRQLLALRVTEPALIDRIEVYLTADPQPSKRLLELKLTGTN